MHRRSGNFRVKKLSYDKFSCKHFFVGTTPYRIVHFNFRKINFLSRHRLYENIFTNENSRFTVYNHNNNSMVASMLNVNICRRCVLKLATCMPNSVHYNDDDNYNYYYSYIV